MAGWDGVVVLAVAIFPMLGIGGMQLYKAEVPGPMKDSKLTPRIAETAKILVVRLFVLTFACALAFWLAGMDTFDAITHSFATVATAGSLRTMPRLAILITNNQPFASYLCCWRRLICFAFYAWRNCSLSHYRNSGELVFFLQALAWVGGIIVLTLWLTNTYSFGDAVRYGIFELVSIVTSTGFGIADFTVWPMFVPILLLSWPMGGCTGSTTGGIKVIRTQLLLPKPLMKSAA